MNRTSLALLIPVLASAFPALAAPGPLNVRCRASSRENALTEMTIQASSRRDVFTVGLVRNGERQVYTSLGEGSVVSRGSVSHYNPDEPAVRVYLNPVQRVPTARDFSIFLIVQDVTTKKGSTLVAVTPPDFSELPKFEFMNCFDSVSRSTIVASEILNGQDQELAILPPVEAAAAINVPDILDQLLSHPNLLRARLRVPSDARLINVGDSVDLGKRETGNRVTNAAGFGSFADLNLQNVQIQTRAGARLSCKLSLHVRVLTPEEFARRNLTEVVVALDQARGNAGQTALPVAKLMLGTNCTSVPR